MAEKIIDIYDGNLSIWKVGLNDLREQDKNARVMSKDKFERLSSNMMKDHRLESLPYCTHADSKGKFHIISGHHRVRSARQAGINDIFILVENKDLTEAEVKSKQLAHNSLSGYDDPELLKELYLAIDDVNARIESGLNDEDFKKIKSFSVPAVSVDFDYEEVRILFLKTGYEDYMNLIERIGTDTKILLADKKDFDKYSKAVQAVAKKYDIRNIAAIMAKIIEIVRDKLSEDSDSENPL